MRLMSAAAIDKRVLVVDDLPSTRMLVVDMLREMGFTEIIEASNGVEALKKIVDNKPSLMVCDYVMNGMSGVDLLRVIRTMPELASLPVIMLSSNREVPFVDSALAAGATDYLVKPVSFNMLKRRILEIFG
jgi:two-component system chemotaxis response regulator CheY